MTLHYRRKGFICSLYDWSDTPVLRAQGLIWPGVPSADYEPLVHHLRTLPSQPLNTSCWGTAVKEGCGHNAVLDLWAPQRHLLGRPARASRIVFWDNSAAKEKTKWRAVHQPRATWVEKGPTFSVNLTSAVSDIPGSLELSSRWAQRLSEAWSEVLVFRKNWKFVFNSSELFAGMESLRITWADCISSLLGSVVVVSEGLNPKSMHSQMDPCWSKLVSCGLLWKHSNAMQCGRRVENNSV